MDLKPAMTLYRECARHVWNTYFQSMPDGWHEFAPVEDALFSGLVLGSFEPGEGLYRKHPDGYFETIVVAPIEVPGRIPIQHVRVEEGKHSQWQMGELDTPIDLRFIEFFDHADYRDPKDLKWVRSRVVGPAGHPLLGEDVLIEYECARFEAITRASVAEE